MIAAFTALFASASKIVFLMIAGTVCVGLFLKIIDPKDFLVLAGMVFTYYFTMQPAASQPVPPPAAPTDAVAAIPPLPPTLSETTTKTTTATPAMMPGVK